MYDGVTLVLSLEDMKNASLPKIVCDVKSFPLQFNKTNDDFEDYKTAISRTVENNLTLLEEIPIPTNFDLSLLREFLERSIKSDLTNDLLFEKSVEIGKYSKDMAQFMNSYFNEIFSFHEQLKKDLQLDLFFISRMFLNSDLPMQFMKAIGDSILVEGDYIDVFDKRIRKEHLYLLANRNNRPRFERICESHNRWAGPSSERLDRIERTRVKLIWYVDFNNSSSLDEIFKRKIIKMSCLDRKVLFSFAQELRNQTEEMAGLNATLTESFPILSYLEQDGARAMLKMIKIIENR